MLDALAALLALFATGGYALTLAVSAARHVSRQAPMRWRPPWWSLIAAGTAIAAIGFDAAFGRAMLPIPRYRAGPGGVSIGLLALGVVVAIVGAWRGAVARWRMLGEFNVATGSGGVASTPVPPAEMLHTPEPFRGTGWPGWSPPRSPAPGPIAPSLDAAPAASSAAPPTPLSAEARAELARITSPALRGRLEQLMIGRARPDRAKRMAIARGNVRAGVACLVAAAAVLWSVRAFELAPDHPFGFYAAPAAFLCCVCAVIAFSRAGWYAMRI